MTKKKKRPFDVGDLVHFVGHEELPGRSSYPHPLKGEMAIVIKSVGAFSVLLHHQGWNRQLLCVERRWKLVK
jgi:hypothetical protein